MDMDNARRILSAPQLAAAEAIGRAVTLAGHAIVADINDFDGTCLVRLVPARQAHDFGARTVATLFTSGAADVYGPDFNQFQEEVAGYFLSAEVREALASALTAELEFRRQKNNRLAAMPADEE